MGDITDTEREILTEFKRNLSDLDLKNNYLLQDKQLIRWLRARDMHLQKAEEMLRNHLAFREEQDIENLMKRSIPESTLAEFPFETFGHDKQGNVLVYIPFGKMDMKKGLKERGRQEANEMSYYYMEKTFQAVVASTGDEKVMRRFSPIVDFTDLSYFQFANVNVLNLLLSSLKLFEKHYPEFLGTGFMVNTPTLWSLLWATAKPLLHQKTQDKIVLTGCDPKQTSETLLKYVDKEQLPEKYGGTVVLKYPEPRIISDHNENSEKAAPTNKSIFRLFNSV